MYSFDQFKKVLSYAKKKNATSLQITAGAVPAVRVGGKFEYTPFDTVCPGDTKNFIIELLNDEQKNELKINRSISLPVAFENIGRVRANIYMQRGSYSINFNILDRLLKTPEELGIPDVVMDLHKKKSGLILICGHSNNGISTTRASIIKKISETRECNIITIEDPIKYLFKHDKAIVNQKEIGIDTNSFQEGVNSAMRQDPDVIMISHAGDPETFSSALAAAENGHLVIASLYTFGSVNTIIHIIEMFPMDKRNYIKMQLNSNLQAIISQQLVPTRKEKGCIPAMEILLATSAVKNLIIENKIQQIPNVIKASKALGMIAIEDYIKDLHSRGLI